MQTMIRQALFRVHWLLGLTVGLVLSLMGLSGALMAFDEEIMTAASHGIVDVAVIDAPVLSPDTLLARFHQQSADSVPVKLTLFPTPGRAARLIYRPQATATLAPDEENTEGTYLDPYTGRVLGPAVGERFFDTVRSFHRFLLLPHNRGGIGRPITAFAAICLVYMALSGLYLRWPRRVLDWRVWLKPDLKRRGRILYWSLHTVAGTWLFLIFLVFAITGPTFGYDGYRDALAALLTSSQPHAAEPASAGGTVRLDPAWSGFQATVHSDVTSVLVPISAKPTPTVTLRYLTRNSPHYRAYNDIKLDRVSGAVVSHKLFASQSLGKQISIGMYSVHRGRVFGLAGAIVFMLAALMVSFFCVTGYLLYLDRRRKKARARAAVLGSTI